MKQVLHNILSARNYHPRDRYIQFFEKEHKYIITYEPDVKYTSVTTWIHEFFEKFDADKIIQKMMSGKSWKEGHKYWGMTSDQIKEQWNKTRDYSANSGTNMHFQIECFHNHPTLENYSNKELYEDYLSKNQDLENQTTEWKYFMNFIKDHLHLKPYRTEWTVYDEDAKISGSIDMVYENQDGTLSIYDWKRSKDITRINSFNKFALPPTICHLPDSNFWHYALQLNTYKYILENNYEKKIKDMFLVRLHPDAKENNYELIQLPDLQPEIKELIKIHIPPII